MVKDDEAVNEGQIEEEYTLPDPQQEYERALSNYLYTSRNYKMYWFIEDYMKAEEVAWERVVRAHANLPSALDND